MAGTKAGAAKAKRTFNRRYGQERRKDIARLGGLASSSRPFRDNPDLAKQAGAKSRPFSKLLDKYAIEYEEPVVDQ